MDRVKEIHRLMNLAESRIPGSKSTLINHCNLWISETSINDPEAIELVKVEKISRLIDMDLLLVRNYLNVIEPEKYRRCPICGYAYKASWFYRGVCNCCIGNPSK